MDYQKAMLEELMSQYVDVDNKDFWDDSVCKHYLVAFCPSQLFTNTKSDLGACDKIHNDRLKEKYQKSDKSKYPYEAEFLDYLNKLISDLGRKIRQGNGRLNIQSDDKLLELRKEEREEKMVLLDVKIKELLQKVEEAGEEGRVQEAADLQSQVDKLQEELELVKQNKDGLNPAEKRMEVCDVCGAFLVTNDSSDRLEAHYRGKQHQGYLKIRDTINEMKQSRQQQQQQRPHSNYSRQRYDYHERRDGGRNRDYRRYSDRERRDRYHRRDHDDFAGDIENYSRRSRQDEYRSRSPVKRSRSRSPVRKHRYD
ncbi:hypothetical protein G6F46_011438 [Rhizopus delemar]|uniref:Uncharacterized protein n=3 Tax=Rhizopus TaxID=4842 RepID=I1BLW2_RHIO9|nr:hypothetical protein RO3G_01896 [Rhizopus delemar RA 99-880]KAG1042887.1 hypothetical protein G6F43_011791 [Rhizopus delemar]KAG1535461.1 hypothetical protein G6F51_011525 [Rhizopus arrhizus]KAG1447896.1 hypothetical protein G6F55_010904 [Rhizopus delemar]KAG1491153.1 hypothetical protein G6F54_010223 [Rhizopus delemar]|eukprot:EIE77192.1 hypothetical protein RO3G_01896 [Rhizopus delemar RA 99-880]